MLNTAIRMAWVSSLICVSRTPAPGVPALLTNEAHDNLTAGLREAEAVVEAAEAAHAATPTRLPLGQVNPGQQVLLTLLANSVGPLWVGRPLTPTMLIVQNLSGLQDGQYLLHDQQRRPHPQCQGDERVRVAGLASPDGHAV
ncbi:MAG: hypothetical protein L0H84_13610 [Pseudonocardia sp.]|nr:hypothetical protein [Pseudonocardia sp.]